MDDVIVRPAYPRHSLHNRRRRKNNKEKSAFLTTFKRQLIIAVMVLLAAAAVKSIKSPITYYITERIKFSLVQEMDLNGINSKIAGFIGGQENSVSTYSSDENEDTGVPASADIYVPLEYDDKIDYGGLVEEDVEQAADSSYGEETILDSSNENETIHDSSSENETTSDGSKENVSDDSNAKKGTVENTAKPVALAIPVSGVMSSSFGERLHPTKGVEKFHNGVDIKANSGVPIKAALDGEVIEATYEITYGNFVKIKHDDGLTTIYAHCSVLSVKKGQKVKKGQVIAKVGSTGDSTGPHLHFEVLKNGSPVNPLNYIKVPAK